MTGTARNPALPRVPRVRVLIVAYRSGETVQACVDSLLAQTITDFEVRIVDNGPEGDRAVAALRGLDERFAVIRPGRNCGFAGGNNLAARDARTRWLALLNPDAIAEPEWLETLVLAAEQAGAEMAGSLQLWQGHEGRLDGAGDAYHVSGIAWRGLRGKPRALAPDSGETFAPCAAAALYDRELFERLGGFDEDFFAYHEDVDLAFRMRLAGARTLQVQEARVWHVASGAPGEASALAVRLGTRNRIWTYIKNMPGWLVWALAPLHCVAVLASMLRDLRRRRGRAALDGVLEAIGALGPVLEGRRRVQAHRSASVVSVLRAMTISPWPLLRTGADVRPWQREDVRVDA